MRTSGLPFPRHAYVPVAAHRPSVLGACRRFAHAALRAAGHTPAQCSLALSRLHLFPARGPNVSDWAQHRAAARDTDCGPTLAGTVPQHQAVDAARRLDAEWLPFHWDARLPEDGARLALGLLQGFERWHPFGPATGRAAAAQAQGLVQEVQQRAIPLDPLLHVFPRPEPGQTLVPLDRDGKRRVRTDTLLYQTRLAANYAAQPKYYRAEPHTDPGELLREHQRLTHKLVPRRWQPRAPPQMHQLASPTTTTRGSASGTRGRACAAPETTPTSVRWWPARSTRAGPS